MNSESKQELNRRSTDMAGIDFKKLLESNLAKILIVIFSATGGSVGGTVFANKQFTTTADVELLLNSFRQVEREYMATYVDKDAPFRNVEGEYNMRFKHLEEQEARTIDSLTKLRENQVRLLTLMSLVLKKEGIEVPE
jgi:hypothetical protein